MHKPLLSVTTAFSSTMALAVVLAVVVFGAAVAVAEPTISTNPLDLIQQPVVKLIADCYDDCTIQTLPTSNGELAIAIIKGNDVVDSAVMPVDPGITHKPKYLPPGGTGAISMSTESRTVDDNGRVGTVIAKDTWTFVNYLLRSVSVNREFIPDDMYTTGG